jgi:iron complex transport system permease protein
VKAPHYCLLGLAALVVVTAMVSLGVGPVWIAPGRVIEALRSAGQAGPNATDLTIVWELRFPRVLLGCCVGAGLGAAGAGYQGLFRNPLADPFVIGASSGAAVGATLAIVAGLQGRLFGMELITIAGLAGAIVAVAIVYGIASVGRQVPILSLLLAGATVSSFAGAVVSLLMFLNDEKLSTIVGWLMGSLSGRGWLVLGGMAPLILAGCLTLWVMARSLDSLTFGEETAAALGLRLGPLRGIVVIAASLATAAAVAAGGVIGFVGLISPHVARLMVGARHALVIPASALVGMLLLLVADAAARTCVAPGELPVGVVTALLGSPFFLYLLKSRQGELGSPP